MQQLHTDIVQSFWLRFWREPHRGQHREWRGSIWHEQQAVHDKPTIVANPEEAFEFVRHVLHGQDDHDNAGTTHETRAHHASDDQIDRTGRSWFDRIRRGRQRLKTFWHSSKGPKP